MYSIYNRKTTNSFGIILFTIKHGAIYFFVIKRRISIPMVKLLIYKCESELEESRYINLLSNEEKVMFRTMPYEEIMDYTTMGKYKHNEIDKAWYNELVEKNKKLLLDHSSSNYTCYEFPKGRKVRNESILECSLREFTEETSIPYESIEVIATNPYSYVYTGFDGNKYKSTFFLAYTDIPTKVFYKKYKSYKYISDEVSFVDWLLLHQCTYTMDYNNKKMIQKIHNTISNKLGNPLLYRESRIAS